MNTTLSLSLRPTKLEEVVGQRAVVTAIKAQFASGRAPVAWMFTGPAGVGKTTLAYIISDLMGAGGPVSHVTEVNAANFNKVEDVRDIVERAKYRPLSGAHKVFILDEVQRLTEPAQNVLLKALETTDGAVWILCTTDPAKIIKPLRDRCLSYALRTLNDQEVEALVRRAMTFLQNESARSVSPELFGGAPVQPPEELIAVLIRQGVRSPREILMAVERFAAGMPANEAAQVAGEPPEYIDICRAVMSGNWTKVAELLQQHKNVDFRGLIGLMRYYLKGTLLKETGARATAAAECIVGLSQFNMIEDGATAAALLYKTARAMGKTKQEDF